MTDVKLKCGAPGYAYVTEEVSAEIAWGLLQFHRQDNHVQQGAGGGGGHQPRVASSGKSSKKTDRPSLDNRGGVGDIRGLLGQVQEDDRLGGRGGDQGRDEGVLHQAAQHSPGTDARARGVGVV